MSIAKREFCKSQFTRRAPQWDGYTQVFADGVAMVPWLQAAWPRDGVTLPIPPEMVIHIASFLAQKGMPIKDIARIRDIAVAPLLCPERVTEQLARRRIDLIRRSMIWNYFAEFRGGKA